MTPTAFGANSRPSSRTTTMRDSKDRGIASRAFEAVVMLVSVAVGGRVAWELLRPLLGVLAVAALLLFVVLLVLRRFRGW